MVLKWQEVRCIKTVEFLFIHFEQMIDYALSEALTTYGLIGIKFGFVRVKFMVKEIYLQTLE